MESIGGIVGNSGYSSNNIRIIGVVVVIGLERYVVSKIYSM